MQPSLFTPSDVPSPMGVADAATVATNRFSLPIHSDELGRLPLHRFTMSKADLGPAALNNSCFDLDAGPSLLSTMVVPADAERPNPSADISRGFDAAGLVNMFGMGMNMGDVVDGLEDPQQVYESLFGNMPAMYPDAQDFPGVMGGMDIPGHSSGQGQDFAADAENTLAMWSSAPSDFQ